MAQQFKDAKYKDGILSYNYLGGKEGKGKGGVSIKNINGNWFFVDKSGKVRKDVGIKGKLTSTHMQNLENDGIFAAAKVNKETGGILPEGTGPYAGSLSSDGGVTGTGDFPGRPSEVALADRGGLRLSGRDAYDPTGTSSISPDKRGSIDPAKTLERRGMTAAPAPVLASAPALVSKSPYDKGMIGSGYSDRTYIPDKVSLPSDGSEFETRSIPGVNRSENFDATVQQPMIGVGPETNIAPSAIVPTNLSQSFPYGGNEFEAKQGMGKTPGSVYADSQLEEWGQTSDPRVWYTQEPLTDYIAEEFPDIGPAGSQMAPSPNTSGELSMPVQESTTPGITGTPGILDKKDDSLWGADEWAATGSVMKGVGGLASAWTGIQNYKLARDAHNAQQNQWQANYNQRLKAYEDNKKLANQEIEARNRTLQARGQTANQYSTLA